MAQYDGHIAKRQRTDGGGFNSGGGDFYNRNSGGGRPTFEEKPNHILLMTVINPAYPITTDVIHTICSPSGKVCRIVIFKKNGVQAMVEFDCLEAAERAKQSLNGCDIYSGCCTLKIEFAKPTRLNVYKNDNESWDYTNNSLRELLEVFTCLQSLQASFLFHSAASSFIPYLLRVAKTGRFAPCLNHIKVGSGISD